jgi:hypothetical protein
MITKDKQYLIFEAREGTYRFDIDKGEWLITPPIVLHFTQPIRQRPTSALVSWFANDLCGEYEFWTENLATQPKKIAWLRYLDRCINSGNSRFCTYHYYDVDFNALCEHFSEVVKHLQDIFTESAETRLIYDGWSNLPMVGAVLEGVENNLGYVEFRQELAVLSAKYGLLDLCKEHAPKRINFINTLSTNDMIMMHNVIHNNSAVLPHLETFFYWFTKLNSVFSIWNESCIGAIIEYFYRCNYLNIEPRKDSNFLKLLADVDKNYQVAREVRDKERLAQVYAPYLETLAFEDETYCVVIPKSEEDFKNEGMAQHNCVYTNYYPSIVNENNNAPPLVVFIREKAHPEKSLVTVEVNPTRMRYPCGLHYINQALMRGNEEIEDECLREFVDSYDAHLVSAWGVNERLEEDGYENVEF